MTLLKVNRKLIVLALIGVILYFTASSFYNSGEADEMTGVPAAPAISMEEARQIALNWYATAYGGQPATAERPVFATDARLSTYVAKYELQKEYESVYSTVSPLDYWRVPLKTPQGDTYYVRVPMQEAKVLGWESTAPSEGGITYGLEPLKQALHSIGLSQDDFDLRTPDRRTSSAMQLESKSVRVGEAPLVVNFEIQDNVVVSMLPHFETPKSFVEWVKKQDSGAGLMATVYLVITFILGLLSLILSIRKRKQARFSRGVLFSLVVFSAIGLHAYNSLPAQTASLPVSGMGFISPQILFISNLVIYALLALALYFNAVSGDQIWRERGWNPWPRFREAGFGQHVYDSMGRGYLLCFFIMGVQQILFLIAFNAFGTFSINDPSQSSFNLYWPWLFPTLAWYAGIGEEITFRLFGIGLMRKLLPEGKSTRGRNISRFIAVLVPSLVWAAGHTTYTFYPNYTRLFEVAVLGLIFGYIFLRYGLYTAIFAHVSMDIILMSISTMLSDNSPRGIALGIFYIALPYLVGLIILLLHRLLRKEPQPPHAPFQPSAPH